VEMSFVQMDDVLKVAEGYLARVWKEILGVEIPLPLPRMSYKQAMDDYGIDRPDTRYDLRIKDGTAICAKADFKVFTNPNPAGGVVRCIRAPGGADIWQSEIEKADNSLQNILKGIGAGGLPYVKVVTHEPENTSKGATAVSAVASSAGDS